MKDRPKIRTGLYRAAPRIRLALALLWPVVSLEAWLHGLNVLAIYAGLTTLLNAGAWIHNAMAMHAYRRAADKAQARSVAAYDQHQARMRDERGY